MDDKLFLKKDLKRKKEWINIYLDRFLPRKDEYPKDIHKALRHTLFAGGKKLRPYLAIQTYLLFKDDVETIKPVAASLETLHTYTLIHDDLPEIDNDEIRRGKKACHVLYGPALALMAGDSLLCYSFQILSTCDLPVPLKLKLIKEMAECAGDQGLIAGQYVDIISETKAIPKKTLNYIHHNKTAKLLLLAIRFGALVAKASKEDLARLEKYGEKLGLAFQIVDDILDIEGSSGTLGKTIGKDIEEGKATFPSIYGLDESKEMARKLIDDALKILDYYGEKAQTLKLLTEFIYKRKF